MAQRSTLNAQRSTLNAQRSTLNAQRSTLNAQRSTLNADSLFFPHLLPANQPDMKRGDETGVSGEKP